MLVLSDVTELARLDEMRVEHVAVASHELRTPLTTLRMTLLMLEEGARELGPRDQQLVATALVGVDQLTSTVDEFLDLTRIEAGQLQLAMSKVCVPTLVARAVAKSAARSEAAGVAVQTRFVGEVEPIEADAARLDAVLLVTSLDNALRIRAAWRRGRGRPLIHAKCPVSRRRAPANRRNGQRSRRPAGVPNARVR